MRTDKYSDGYEIVFVPTDEQRVEYEAAIRKATWVNPKTGEREPVRLSIKRDTRFGVSGWRFCIRTKSAEWKAADIEVDKYVHATFPVGTRGRTVAPLHRKGGERPIGTGVTVTGTEGYAWPLFTFDGDPSGPYTVGPWWVVPV